MELLPRVQFKEDSAGLPGRSGYRSAKGLVNLIVNVPPCSTSIFHVESVLVRCARVGGLHMDTGRVGPHWDTTYRHNRAVEYPNLTESLFRAGKAGA